jgi:hypothetical protein
MNERTPPSSPSQAPASTGSAPGASSGKPKSNNERWDEDEEPWRHPPVAPVDESPLDSLGRSVSEAVIGSTPGGAPDKPKPKP